MVGLGLQRLTDLANLPLCAYLRDMGCRRVLDPKIPMDLGPDSMHSLTIIKKKGALWASFLFGSNW